MVDEREPSLCSIHPPLRLAAGIVKQAVEDYTSDDVVKALDALAWFLDEGGAGLLLDALELPTDPDRIFERLAYGKHVSRSG